MAWQDKGRRQTMGQFVRIKAERMVIVRFDGEPIEVDGQDFQKNPRKEFHFPVSFYDERSVSLRYKEGEATSIVLKTAPEDKMFPAGSPILMRALLEEDEEESIMGRTFIITHTGASRDTVYKLREVKVPKQAKIHHDTEEEEESEEDNSSIEEQTEEEQPKAGPHPRKEPVIPPTKKNRKTRTTKVKTEDQTREEEANEVQPTTDTEKDKFMREVKKRTEKKKKQEQEEEQLETLEELEAEDLSSSDEDSDTMNNVCDVTENAEY